MEGVDHLAPERNKAQFDVDEMKIVWAGSRHAFEVSDRMSRLVASDPVRFPLILLRSLPFHSDLVHSVASNCFNYGLLLFATCS